MSESGQDWTEQALEAWGRAASTLELITVDLEKDGTLDYPLPWSLDYPEAGVRTVRLSWEQFGMPHGLN